MMLPPTALPLHCRLLVAHLSFRDWGHAKLRGISVLNACNIIVSPFRALEQEPVSCFKSIRLPNLRRLRLVSAFSLAEDLHDLVSCFASLTSLTSLDLQDS